MGLTLGQLSGLTGMIGFARNLVVDVDSTDPAAADSVYTLHINDLYLRAHEAFPRYQLIDAATSGLTVSSALSAVTTLTNIVEIVDVGINTSGAAATMPDTYSGWLERISVDEAIRSQAESAFTLDTTKVPKWAAEYVQTDTEASIGKWRIYFNKQLSENPGYAVLRARLRPAILASANDEPDLPDEMRYTIARAAGAVVALSFGEDPEFVQSLLAPIPEQVQRGLGVWGMALRPKGKELERVA